MVLRIAIVCMSCITGLAIRAHGSDPSAGSLERRGKQELERLVGKWRHTIDTKSGWKGDLVANFKLVEARDKSYHLNVQYDAKATRGDEQFGLLNAPAFPVRLAAYQRDKSIYLVAIQSVAILQINPEAKDERVSFQLEDDELTVDARDGYRHFVGSKAISDLDLPWTNLHLKRVK